ncbi:structure-specific endonuclease subunit SLX4 isoform X1 [Acanthochromis polyacanthus]|uniref:structure-specific endonuclease subunit SLX4 isoform X1 n=1 Tax=Acanthochromis polyacanthus TaxID=80966 RepID=UPI002233EC3D|nr:structure-specific endonuclease subunit SLX4 isoform X1 [Acanthochromis polyacanthus]
MDDSDQDFVDLCSKPLKRVRQKPSVSSQPRKAQHQSCSQTSDRDVRRRNNRKDTDSASQPVSAGAEQHVDSGGTGHDSGDAGSSVVPSAAGGPRSDRGQRAKDKVLFRMQQFRRASPPKMVHSDKSQPTSQDCAPFAEQQREGTTESFSSVFHPEPPDSDEALALRLQQQLDREAAEAQTVDLEDGGLFFCQICHKDLSHMTPEGRTQHLNRCLDESEESAPAPPPPPSVPDCPICGKKFKSQKSRSAHLKRCSSDMGVSPAVLLQALQRQAEENKSTATANTHIQTVGTKRKGPSKSGLQARKKPRKKTEPMDEETMVALALSSSLLEQQKEQLRETEAERQLQPETAASHSSITPLLKWRTDAGKGRGKRKKGAVPRPPPLLLVQDAEAALTRLQERVSALLLRSRAPSPPTPTLCPSTLPSWSGAAPLWQKSALLDGGSTSMSDFYAPQLREFFTPQESVTTDAASFSTNTKPESSLQPVAERTPLSGTRASILLSPSRTASCSPVPSTPVGSQVLRDLMELAEEGMTLSQYGYTARGSQINAGLSTNLPLSGFIQEESEEQVDLCASGFLPEKTNADLEETYSQVVRTTDQPRAVKETNRHQSATLSRLASDLSSMVNNPQLSDVQLQVDSGEIYFAHSFMVYARCPLLAEMVHESGFGVQEEDTPAGKRVLINDVPGQAVFTLLQYLYTAHCSIPASLQPHLLELASRFDLQELQQLCQLHPDEAAALRDEADYTSQEENYNSRTDQAILELLRSMWNGEDEDNDGADSDGHDEGRRLEEDRQADEVASGDREICEEQVNEEELEEIYEFAATQRKREETDSQEEEEEDEEERLDEEDGDVVFTKLREHKTGFCEKSLQPNSELEPNLSLDRSYNRLFSDSWGVYEEGDRSSVASTSTRTKTTQSKHKSLHKPSSELSGRILLQSSASLVDDLSLSPPPSTSNMPTAGLSPGPVGDLGGDKGEEAVEQDVPLKRESQGPRSICIPPHTDSPQKKEEPELIVLSDSGEEMEVDVAVLSSHSPLPFSPSVQSCTEIKSKQIPPRKVPALENKESSSLELSPADALACSPEVSWLIPSTPVHPGRSTTSSSTQTQSSMCRTQLFPKGDASPPSASVFSSPALPSNSRLHTSNSPTKVSAYVGPTEDSVSRLKLSRMIPSSSSLDLSVFPNKSNNSSVLLSKSTNSYSLKASLKQDTPLHLQPQLHSSTPLHTDLHQPPVLLAASPLHTDLDEQRSAPLERTETTELGSFHLSPLSDPSERLFSSSHSGLQNSKRHSKSSSQSQHSVESSSRDNAGVELTRREERNEELEGDNKDWGGEEQEDAKGATGGADGAESSFHQSFLDMDEPPIAFNDSWGLDACVDNSPGCVSLRLEDSGRSGKQEHSSGQQETASPPSKRSVQSLDTRDSVTPPAPPKGQQPCSRLQARASPGFDKGLLDSKIWDSWEEEEEEEEVLPLSQRLNPSAQLKTPVSTCSKRKRSLVPITPMPHYSDMDTPELKNKLNRFGVRPLPKRQMILKLKEIHQYTHQLVSSDSEDDAPPAGQTAQIKPPVSRPASSVKFTEPLAAVSPVKQRREDEAEPLSASQGSNTSSTAASEESERSNPELCVSSDGESDSDAGISCSQAASRLQDRLKAVRSFILSDSQLYSQILQYQPLVLSRLQQQLKAAGIRLGAAKLVDYLDSQCITFTTAKPGHSAPSRRQGRRTERGAKTGGRGASRKKVVAAMT